MIGARFSTLLIGILFTAGLLFWPSFARGQSIEIQQDIRVASGLRQRRMFDLAEQLCRNSLTNRELSPTDQVSLHLELIHVYVSKAVVSTGVTRNDAWESAHSVAQQFLSANSQHPRRLLIQVQDALTRQTQGSLMAQEIAAEILGREDLESALTQLRQSTSQFREIESLVDRLMPEQRSKTLGQDDLSPDQLLNLKRNVQFQQAKSNLIKAELFPPNDRLNRIDTLNQVAKRLTEVLNQSNPDEPLWWQAQLNRAYYLRLAGDLAGAANVISQLQIKEIPANLEAKLAVQKIEIVVASGQLGAASSVLQQAAAVNPIPPKLHLAILRLYLAIGAHVESKNDKIRWQNEAARLTRTIELAHGNYWGRRAELLLIGPSARTTDATDAPPAASGSLDISLRVGEQATRKGRFRDAVKAFRRAVQQAESMRDPKQALLANFRLSKAHEQLNEFDLAAETLINASIKYASQSYASDTHLRGCWNWSRVAKLDPTQKNEFPQSLRQHIERWPSTDSANQARAWLANHHQGLAHYEKAIEIYLNINPTSEFASSSAGQIRNCYYGFRKNNSAARTRTLANTIVQSAKRSLGIEPLADIEHNLASRELITTLANIGLSSNTIDSLQIAEALQTQIDRAPDNQLNWKQRAQCWVTVALAADSQSYPKAKTQLTSLPNETHLMSVCANGLSDVAKHDRVDSKRIAELQLMVADKALASNPNPKQTSLWHARRARALQDMGQTSNAVELLRNLAKQNPKSLDIQLRLGRALSETAPNANETLTQWRIVASKVKPGTPAWYESKYNVAQSMSKTGDAKKALELLKYINAVHPWKGSAFQKQLEQLRQDLERAK